MTDRPSTVRSEEWRSGLCNFDNFRSSSCRGSLSLISCRKSRITFRRSATTIPPVESRSAYRSLIGDDSGRQNLSGFSNSELDAFDCLSGVLLRFRLHFLTQCSQNGKRTRLINKWLITGCFISQSSDEVATKATHSMRAQSNSQLDASDVPERWSPKLAIHLVPPSNLHQFRLRI